MSGRVFATRRRTLLRSAPAVRRVVQSPGRSLAPALRGHMESRLGADFSRVRIHTDREAARSARALNARAYTFGSDVVFGAGQYSPETAAGRRLIAHELAHVVQQRSGGAAAQRVMRSPFSGCDKATTGLDDADARMQDAQAKASTMLAGARAAFPQMDSATIALVDEHFHCPSHSDLKTIIATLAKMDPALAQLQLACLSAKTKICKDGDSGKTTESPSLAEFCPVVFAARNRAARFPGLILDAAAQVAGLKNLCLTADACYDDFVSFPASKMVDNAVSYAAFAVELAGGRLHTGFTIPCDPYDTGILVDVPPGAVKDPDLIREHSGLARAGDPPLPAGTVIHSVFADQAGKRFIYHAGMPGARVFTAKEAAEKPPRLRFYFPAGHALSRK